MRRIRIFFNLWGMRWHIWEAMTGENSRLGMREAWRVSKEIIKAERQLHNEAEICASCLQKQVIRLEGSLTCLACGASVILSRSHATALQPKPQAK
jgi:ribosomal protein L37AE/L43A